MCIYIYIYMYTYTYLRELHILRLPARKTTRYPFGLNTRSAGADLYGHYVNQ